MPIFTIIVASTPARAVHRGSAYRSAHRQSCAAPWSLVFAASFNVIPDASLTRNRRRRRRNGVVHRARAGLQLVEPCVEAPVCPQFIMRSGFDNLAAVEHEDLVGPSHGRE